MMVFGSQYLSMISVYAYAKHKGLEYKITPWKKMHFQNPSKMFKFAGGYLYGKPSDSSTKKNGQCA